MNLFKSKRSKRIRRHRRVRANIMGTALRPRLSVFRSNKHLHLQLIDDEAGRTLVAAETREVKKTKGKQGSAASEVGTLLAKKALEKGIKEIVFDRGGYRYHGNIKKLADAARAGGLKF
ncbi:MAG: 50S ribosomal protein L18 [Candidatus Sungbacteria bacterium]|nr:50S ribosomal protein L18 [Candidatus Sungbacteria bacterium]